MRIAMLLMAGAAAAGCGTEAHFDPHPAGDQPVRLNLQHLRHLTLDAIVKDKPVRVVALYAAAPHYRATPSPERDGSEGIASVDDAARAAIVYLRAYEMSGDTLARRAALGLLDFIAAMEQGDGEFINFIDARGRPNHDAPSSRKSMSYWAARGIWALGEAARVLGPEQLPQRAVLTRALARMKVDVEAGRLIGGSITATAEALLGLLALQRALPAPDIAALAASTGELLVTRREMMSWHAWGARRVEALAAAGLLLKRADLVAAARAEADTLWSKFLLAGQVPAEITSANAPKWFSQIAYGISPIVGGYLALAEATGEEKYAVFAGLTASWLLGANPARVPMYDERTGRTFDGIDGPATAQVNRNSGAESTVESMLALQLVNGNPEAAEYLRYQPVGELSTSFVNLPALRRFTGPRGGRLAVRRTPAGLDIADAGTGAEPITLTYWPAANPPETRLAMRLAAQWNAEHPDIQVRVQPLPAGRSSEEVLLAAIVAKATPDVSSNVSSALLARLVRAGGVIRLDDRVATAARLQERTSPAMLASLRLPDGGIYAFPWKTNPEMLLYNIDLLAQAGVAPPRTHSELLEAFRRLARDTNGDGRNDRWPMWVTLKTTWHERFYDFYPLYLASSGGTTLISNGEVVFENEAAVSALEVLRRGFAEGTLPQSNFALGRDPFADGTVAMKIIGPWFMRELDEIKAPGLRYDVAPMPAADGTPMERRFAYADLRNIAIFSTTRHADAAARFVAYLTSPAADRWLIEEASQLPYRRGLANDVRFTNALTRWPALTTYAGYVERTRDLDIDPDVVEIFDLLSEAYEQAAVYRVVPVREALRRAASEARKVIDAR